jgi:hypothetical protein
MLNPSFRSKYHSEENEELRQRYLTAKCWIYRNL